MAASKRTIAPSRTVIGINTFRGIGSRNAETDQYYDAFTAHAQSLIERTKNACERAGGMGPVVLVSANGFDLVRLLDKRVFIVPEPARFTEGRCGGPVALVVLAAALKRLQDECKYKPDSPSYRVMYMSPWHTSQNDSADESEAV